MDNRIQLLKDLEKVLLAKIAVIKTQKYVEAAELRDQEKKLIKEIEELFSDDEDLLDKFIEYRNGGISIKTVVKVGLLQKLRSKIRRDKIKNILADDEPGSII